MAQQSNREIVPLHRFRSASQGINKKCGPFAIFGVGVQLDVSQPCFSPKIEISVANWQLRFHAEMETAVKVSFCKLKITKVNHAYSIYDNCFSTERKPLTDTVVTQTCSSSVGDMKKKNTLVQRTKPLLKWASRNRGVLMENNNSLAWRNLNLMKKTRFS